MIISIYLKIADKHLIGITLIDDQNTNSSLAYRLLVFYSSSHKKFFTSPFDNISVYHVFLVSFKNDTKICI